MHRSVNQIFNEFCSTNGSPVEVEGILNLQPEGYELLHYPKAERRDSEKIEGSSVWLVFGNGAIQPNHSALSRWLGKRVRAHGILKTCSNLVESREFHQHGGYGPYGLWLAQLEVYSIQRVTSEVRKENGS